MIVAAAGADTGFAAPFWKRDLGALVRRLADPSPAPDERDRELFGDLVRLANCEPLPELQAADPEWPVRELVRVEAARARGAGRADGAALWRDWMRPEFFLRRGTLQEAEVLRWPTEAERWPDERIEVPLASSRCGAGMPPRTEVVTAELITRLQAFAASSHLDAGAVPVTLAYAFATARAPSEALPRAVVDSLDPSRAEPRLRPYLRLLRAERSLAPASEYLALADERALGDARWVAVAHALTVAADPETAVRITADFDGLPAGTAPDLVAFVAYHRARALLKLGRREEAKAVFRNVPDAVLQRRSPQARALWDLALAVVTYGPLSPGDLAQLDRLDAWEAVGERALVSGRDDVLRAAIDRLAKARPLHQRTLAARLACERAFAQRDAAAFQAGSAQLLSALAADASATERAAQSRDLVALFESLVRRDAERPERSWEARLHALMDQAAGWLDERDAHALNGLSVLLASNAKSSSRAEVALGTLPVSAEPEPPPLPALTVSWPQPYSLLAIPKGDGTLASGALGADAAAEVKDDR